MLGCACRREHLKRRSMARLLARFQFHVGEPLQSRGDAEILGGGFSERRLQLAAHGRQTQLIQFLFEGCHRIPFRIRE